jgi:phosphate transport system protein
MSEPQSWQQLVQMIVDFWASRAIYVAAKLRLDGHRTPVDRLGTLPMGVLGPFDLASVGHLEMGEAAMPPAHDVSLGRGSTMVRHALKDQENLWGEVLKLSAIVSAALTTSVQALRDNRADLARKVKVEEKTIDNWEVKIELQCERILARYAPTASDLRRVMAAMRISSELERMADLAEHIADRVKKRVATAETAPIPSSLDALATASLAQVRDSLEALHRYDVELAKTVIREDRGIDQLRRSVLKELKDAIRQEPERVDTWLRLINTARNLERVSDHASNIAETVIYLIHGSDPVPQPIMPLDLPVKVRPWELTVYPRSHIRR